MDTTTEKVHQGCESLDSVVQAFMALPGRNGSQEHTARLLQKLEPVSDRTMATFLQDDQLMERVCRCWKYGIRASKQYFKPMIFPLLKCLSDLFPKYPHSSFLYIVCVCVNEFGAEKDCQKLLQAAYEMFTKHGMSKLTSEKAYEEHPDIVGDYYDMQKRYLFHCPQIVFNSDLLENVFQCALVGIGVGHRDACTMLMKFFATFIKMGFELRKNPEMFPNSAKALDMLGKIMNKYGYDLTLGLLEGVARRLPFSRIQFCVEVIENLTRCCSPMSKEWFGRALRNFPATEYPSHEQLLQELFKERPERQEMNSRAVKDVVKNFAKAVRAKIR